MRRRETAGGFTLVESLMAAVVLLACVVAISLALSAGHMQNHQAEQGQRAMGLVEEMMEMIVARPYNDPQGASNLGPEAGEIAVADFDNTDDFHGYVDSAATSINAAGQVYPSAYQNLTRTVTVQEMNAFIGGIPTAVVGQIVTVVVTDGQGRTRSASRFIPASGS
jgi:Tfp pilus assembly protein PilV